ncbi:MAG: D-glycero-beta-D-manno-heptose 1-phosphate adenylyltransferase [Deltaproteobacteria bacterium]|nr:MAG: D-glycero-beta-D-manno-heptose 1-phosphate adenylyltransferase [Deltaproteobacteria bacterium]
MRPWGSKIKGLDELKVILSDLKAQGKRIVFTNGCFDLLHPGHIWCLQEAKALGDVLVVAVNSDESVRRLKGPGRPIMSLEARMKVLSALEAVDFVLPFEEDTPLRVISELKPHVLVKGGDWKPEEVVGRELVQEVRIIPYRKGFSTTEIIRRILKLGA